LALAVPLSRFTPRVGGGSAFFVRQHHTSHNYENHQHHVSYRSFGFVHGLLHASITFSLGISRCFSSPKRDHASDSERLRQGRMDSCVGLLRHRKQSSDVCFEAAQEVRMTMLPNQSPEPTAVGAGRSAIAVHVASRRWLSFFR